MRGILLIITLILFLLELYGRSTMLGQLQMARATFQAWWAAQQELLESLQMRPKAPAEEFVADDSAKVMDAYRRLATRVYERTQKKDG
jgi:hypothetical protein